MRLALEAILLKCCTTNQGVNTVGRQSVPLTAGHAPAQPLYRRILIRDTQAKKVCTHGQGSAVAALAAKNEKTTTGPLDDAWRQ